MKKYAMLLVVIFIVMGCSSRYHVKYIHETFEPTEPTETQDQPIEPTKTTWLQGIIKIGRVIAEIPVSVVDVICTSGVKVVQAVTIFKTNVRLNVSEERITYEVDLWNLSTEEVNSQKKKDMIRLREIDVFWNERRIKKEYEDEIRLDKEMGTEAFGNIASSL